MTNNNIRLTREEYKRDEARSQCTNVNRNDRLINPVTLGLGMIVLTVAGSLYVAHQYKEYKSNPHYQNQGLSETGAKR